MAQTYKIYLKKRLTEFDLIIKNLPYRDEIVVYNKLYLDAMVNYLNIQRFIIGKTDTELISQIDNILEQVFNIFNNGLEISANIDFICQKSEFFNSKITLDTNLSSLTKEYLNVFDNFNTLTASISNYELAKSLGSGHSSLELDTQSIHTLKECFEKLNNHIITDYKVSTNARIFISMPAKMNLTTDNFDIFYVMALQCEAVCNLLCNADVELWYTLGNAINNTTLSVCNNSVKSEKFIPYNDLLSLITKINTVLYCMAYPSPQTNLLNLNVDIETKRCRLLNEIDNSTLSNIEADSLNDLDYVIIL